MLWKDIPWVPSLWGFIALLLKVLLKNSLFLLFSHIWDRPLNKNKQKLCLPSNFLALLLNILMRLEAWALTPLVYWSLETLLSFLSISSVQQVRPRGHIWSWDPEKQTKKIRYKSWYCILALCKSHELDFTINMW